jgi:hypothetical protein
VGGCMWLCRWLCVVERGGVQDKWASVWGGKRRRRNAAVAASAFHSTPRPFCRVILAVSASVMLPQLQGAAAVASRL